MPYALVAGLVLRRCLLEGKTNVTGLANALALTAGLVDKIVQELREKKEIEVLGMVGRDYTLALTGLGQQHANDRLAQSRYAGACPVSLDQYREVVARQRLLPRRVDSVDEQLSVQPTGVEHLQHTDGILGRRLLLLAEQDENLGVEVVE